MDPWKRAKVIGDNPTHAVMIRWHAGLKGWQWWVELGGVVVAQAGTLEVYDREALARAAGNAAQAKHAQR